MVDIKLPPRKQSSHKGSFGKVLNIAGSLNYIGAAYLSSISALKAYCGYMSKNMPGKLGSTIALQKKEEDC